MQAPRRTTAPGTIRAPRLRNAASSKPPNRVGTLSQNGPGAPAGITRMSLQRKYSSTAFFSHSLTCQPPSTGSATRAAPDSSKLIARSTIGRTDWSISSVVRPPRRSKASSIALRSSALAAGSCCVIPLFYFQAGDQRRAQIFNPWFGQRFIMLIADQEYILDPLAKGGDAGIMHAQPIAAKHLRHIGQQSGPVGGHQAEPGSLRIQGVEVHARRHPEVAQVARRP